MAGRKLAPEVVRAVVDALRSGMNPRQAGGAVGDCRPAWTGSGPRTPVRRESPGSALSSVSNEVAGFAYAEDRSVTPRLP